MALARTGSLRKASALICFGICAYAACSSTGSTDRGSGNGGPDGSGGETFYPDPDGDGIPNVDIDVDYKQVEQEFWVPPKFPKGGSGCTGSEGPWAEAVQKALWFYHINKSGPGITHSYVQWRGDSHLEDGSLDLDPDSPNGVDMSKAYIDKWRSVLDPDGNGKLDMSGGYYDAGDFQKIGITQNYAAHTLAWTMREFPSAFKDTGLEAEALGILRWFSDHFMKNTYIANPAEPDPWKHEVVAYGHQVGAASDHECGWMPPELRRTRFCPRKGFFATQENPASNVTAGAAAALAIIGWLHKDRAPDYATRCLNTAIALYNFSKQHAGTNWSVDGGLYVSEGTYDDLAWAALWLHEVLPQPNQPGANELTELYASHKQSYLDDLVGPGNWLEKFEANAVDFSCMKTGAICGEEHWTHIWNSLRSGVFLKLAEILARKGNTYATLAKGFRIMARDDSMLWVLGPKTDGGFSKKVDVSWGSGRYNSAGQLVALAYAKIFPDDVIPTGQPLYDGTGYEGQNTAGLLVPWAKTQSEYLLGKNPLGKSYMMGFGEKYAESPHHAATHASIYGLCDKPIENKHIAYGALVSGPNSGDDHSDDRCDYGANEITIDYNAAFLGALAGNYAFQGEGQCPVDDFPPVEPPFFEFYTESRVNTTSDCRVQVEITLVNETAHPPRFDTTLTTRYYINVSELQSRGIDPNTVSASIVYQSEPDEPTLLSELKACKLNTSTYYFELSYPYEFWGRQVKLKGPRTVLLDVGVANGTGCIHNALNDWSFAELTSEVAKSPKVPAYSNGQIVWGEAPECDDPPVQVIPPTVVR